MYIPFSPPLSFCYQNNKPCCSFPSLVMSNSDTCPNFNNITWRHVTHGCAFCTHNSIQYQFVACDYLKYFLSCSLFMFSSLSLTLFSLSLSLSLSLSPSLSLSLSLSLSFSLPLVCQRFVW